MRRLIDAARQGSIRAASRLISRLEDDPALVPEMLAGLREWPRPRLVVGLTGAPGVGKSTLIDGLIGVWRRRCPEALIGVLAVDPSSPFTGGAVLGDRIRMMRHATDDKVFIRSLASRGHLGGLTAAIRGTLRVLGLVGCAIALIETVGVGQGEVEIAGVADLTVVVLAPDGDSIQLLKGGLIELGDLFVVNKADRPGAERLIAALTATLSMAGATAELHPLHEERCAGLAHAPADQGRAPIVFPVHKAMPADLDALVDGIEREATRRGADLHARRQSAVRDEVRRAVLESVFQKAEQVFAATPNLEARLADILAGRARVAEVAGELLQSAAGKQTVRVLPASAFGQGEVHGT